MVMGAVFYGMLLAPKKKIVPIIYIAIMFSTYFMYPVMPQYLGTALALVLEIVLVCLLYKGPLRIKVLLSVISYIIITLADIITMLIFLGLGFLKDFSEMKAISYQRNLGILTCLVIAALLYLLFLKIWKRVHKDEVSFKYIIFAIFPISQLFLLYGAFNAYDIGGEYAIMGYSIAGIGFAVLSNFYIFRVIGQLREKTALEQKIIQMQQQQQLTYGHILETETTNKQGLSFHHDIKNQLSVIQLLLTQGQYKESADIVNQLSDDISVFDNRKICAHPVVNAVLVQKSTAALSLGITTKLDVFIQEQTPIESIDLCSVFSNLIDNAMEACKEINDGSIVKYIEVQSGVKQDYLTIKVKNSKVNRIVKENDRIKTTKSASGSHGIGLSIVERIALKYDGAFTVDYNDDSFAATVLLSTGRSMAC
jgi:sensor histidine kinase YesM